VALSTDDLPSAPVGSALAEPGVRERLARRRRLGRRLFAVGAALLFLGAVGTVVIDRWYGDRQQRLDRHPGEIVTLRDAGGDDDGGTAEVTFSMGGRRQSAAIDVADTSDWYAGEHLTVLVDHSSPSFVTLWGENYLPGWFAALPLGAMLGAFLLIAGGATVITTARKTAALAAGPWQPVAGSVITVGSGESSSSLVFLEGPGRESFWRLKEMMRPAGPFRGEAAGPPEERTLVVRRHDIDEMVRVARAETTRPTVGRLEAVEQRADAVALRVGAADGWSIFEVNGALWPVDPDALSATDGRVTVWRGPNRVAALLLPGRESAVLGVELGARKARRRWRDAVSL
jgi:hypothetical protein